MDNITNNNFTVFTEKSMFSRTTTVKIDIYASKSIIWKLLTNADDLIRWNSTIISIEGDIELNSKIKLRSHLDPKRVFKLKVKKVDSEDQMIWGSPLGNRRYQLSENTDSVSFVMSETIGGPFFPLFANKIPSFDESFSVFANDLKKESEEIMRAYEEEK